MHSEFPKKFAAGAEKQLRKPIQTKATWILHDFWASDHHEEGSWSNRSGNEAPYSCSLPEKGKEFALEAMFTIFNFLCKYVLNFCF